MGSSDTIQTELDGKLSLVDSIVAMAAAVWFEASVSAREEDSTNLSEMDTADTDGQAQLPTASSARVRERKEKIATTGATVKEGPESFEHFLFSAFSCRVYDGCFLIQGYDMFTKWLLDGQYELVTKEAGVWTCRCKKSGVSGSCWHTKASAVLETNTSYKACGFKDQNIIACNSVPSIWAVLGGAGTSRSVVVRDGNHVRVLLSGRY